MKKVLKQKHGKQKRTLFANVSVRNIQLQSKKIQIFESDRFAAKKFSIILRREGALKFVAQSRSRTKKCSTYNIAINIQ